MKQQNCILYNYLVINFLTAGFDKKLERNISHVLCRFKLLRIDTKYGTEWTWLCYIFQNIKTSH